MYFNFIYVLIFCHCDKIPNINNLRNERFILAHGFTGFSPSRWGRQDGVEKLTT
jgi:hypothetical protein